MTWKCYLTIFKAESPIHIGYRQIGILKTTRYYITGRAMWGAITANLTRKLFGNPSSDEYQAVGNFVKENIRTTYFYPAINKNDVKNPNEWGKDVNDYLVFLPEYTKDGLKFGKLNKEKFEQTFIGSFVSTAIDTTSKTAEEGSLHEFEFIKNKIRIAGSSVDVYWVGYLFVKEGGESNGIKIKECSENEVLIEREGKVVKLSEVLRIIYIGGERNYGLGRLKLLDKFFKEAKNKVFNEFDFETSDKIIFKNLDIAISHVKLDDKSKNNKDNNKKDGKNSKNKNELLERGEIEPLVGLEWSDKGAGQKISNAVICITPGSRLPSGEYVVDKYGISSFLTMESCKNTNLK